MTNCLRCWTNQANLPDEAIAPYANTLQTGVHYGYARVVLGDAGTEGEANQVLPMVMSIGWNPYYKNEKRTAVESTFYPVVIPRLNESVQSAGSARPRSQFPRRLLRQRITDSNARLHPT